MTGVFPTFQGDNAWPVLNWLGFVGSDKTSLMNREASAGILFWLCMQTYRRFSCFKVYRSASVKFIWFLLIFAHVVLNLSSFHFWFEKLVLFWSCLIFSKFKTLTKFMHHVVLAHCSSSTLIKFLQAQKYAAPTLSFCGGTHIAKMFELLEFSSGIYIYFNEASRY